MVSAMEVCGVPTENPFVFENLSGAKNPQALSSTRLMEHIATMSKILNLDKNVMLLPPMAFCTIVCLQHCDNNLGKNHMAGKVRCPHTFGHIR